MEGAKLREELSKQTGVAGKQAGTETDARLVEGRDFYFEGGFVVFTAYFLRSRGYCCKNNCRHCPYDVEIAERG
jgi:hypothetical protein